MKNLEHLIALVIASVIDYYVLKWIGVPQPWRWTIVYFGTPVAYSVYAIRRAVEKKKPASDKEIADALVRLSRRGNVRL